MLRSPPSLMNVDKADAGNVRGPPSAELASPHPAKTSSGVPSDGAAVQVVTQPLRSRSHDALMPSSMPVMWQSCTAPGVPSSLGMHAWTICLQDSGRSHREVTPEPGSVFFFASPLEQETEAPSPASSKNKTTFEGEALIQTP